MPPLISHISQLRLAYDALVRLTTFEYSDFEERVFKFLAFFDSKLKGRVSRMSLVIKRGSINVKPGPKVLERAKANTSIRLDELWSPPIICIVNYKLVGSHHSQLVHQQFVDLCAVL